MKICICIFLVLLKTLKTESQTLNLKLLKKKEIDFYFTCIHIKYIHYYKRQLENLIILTRRFLY